MITATVKLIVGGKVSSDDFGDAIKASVYEMLRGSVPRRGVSRSNRKFSASICLVELY